MADESVAASDTVSVTAALNTAQVEALRREVAGLQEAKRLLEEALKRVPEGVRAEVSIAVTQTIQLEKELREARAELDRYKEEARQEQSRHQRLEESRYERELKRWNEFNLSSSEKTIVAFGLFLAWEATQPLHILVENMHVSPSPLITPKVIASVGLLIAMFGKHILLKPIARCWAWSRKEERPIPPVPNGTASIKSDQSKLSENPISLNITNSSSVQKDSGP